MVDNSSAAPATLQVSAKDQVECMWAHWRRLGSPRLLVALMVDNFDLPFRPDHAATPPPSAGATPSPGRSPAHNNQDAF
jgi:hypothetical protein